LFVGTFSTAKDLFAVKSIMEKELTILENRRII